MMEEITLEKTIYGGKPKNPVAYCALHNGSLTVKEMKKKGCLGKQCHHLQKNEQHEYWNQRQIMKARKESCYGKFVLSDERWSLHSEA